MIDQRTAAMGQNRHEIDTGERTLGGLLAYLAAVVSLLAVSTAPAVVSMVVGSVVVLTAILVVGAGTLAAVRWVTRRFLSATVVNPEVSTH